jgi:hypothetical protein
MIDQLSQWVSAASSEQLSEALNLISGEMSKRRGPNRFKDDPEVRAAAEAIFSGLLRNQRNGK